MSSAAVVISALRVYLTLLHSKWQKPIGHSECNRVKALTRKIAEFANRVEANEVAHNAQPWPEVIKLF